MKFEVYILKSLLLGFALAVGGMFFVALPGIAVAAVHKLSGVDLMVVLRFLPLLAAGLVPYVLPIGFLLAVVVTYGRLAADQEWTAMVMAGRNPLRMVLPAFVFGLLLAAGTYGMVGELLPYLKYRTKKYEIEAVSDVLRNLSPGRTELVFNEFYLSAGFREGDVFMDALISLPGEEYKLVAKRVSFSFAGTDMFVNVEDYRIVSPGEKMAGTTMSWKVPLEKLLSGGEKDWSQSRYKTSRELAHMLGEDELSEDSRRKIEFEIHKRLTIASTFFMFLLLGVSTGLILRHGTQLSALAVAVAYSLCYYVLLMRLGKGLAIGGVLPPVVAAWLVPAGGSVIGLFMLRKALRR